MMNGRQIESRLKQLEHETAKMERRAARLHQEIQAKAESIRAERQSLMRQYTKFAMPFRIGDVIQYKGQGPLYRVKYRWIRESGGVTIATIKLRRDGKSGRTMRFFYKPNDLKVVVPSYLAKGQRSEPATHLVPVGMTD